MSLPPVTVHIKRKATDEPVDFLRVHEPHGKRQRRTTDFVFSRQSVPGAGSLTTLQSTTQPSQSIKQIRKATSSTSVSTQLNQGGIQSEPPQPQRVSEVEIPASRTAQDISVLLANAPPGAGGVARGDHELPVQASSVRRFHMSKSSRPTNPLAPLPGGQIRKRKAQDQPAIFMEYKSRTEDSGPHVAQLQGQSSSTFLEQSLHSPKPQPRQKKPGLAVKGSAVSKKDEKSTHKTAQSLAPPRATTPMRLPSGTMMPWDVNSEQLAVEMQAYTLQEIGKNIAEAETFQSEFSSTDPAAKFKKPQSRFKPKKPSLRYPERHPEAAIDTVHIADMEVDQPLSSDEMDDDSDYIIDTYVRMPAHTLESSSSSKNIGILVLDSQPDIDAFYMDEWDSDDEVQDEEEDENAEDHYTADYPDDEVESDDEFGRNPYSYRTHNASDLEEFDEDDATFSDSEMDSAKHPWED